MSEDIDLTKYDNPEPEAEVKPTGTEPTVDSPEVTDTTKELDDENAGLESIEPKVMNEFHVSHPGTDVEDCDDQFIKPKNKTADLPIETFTECTLTTMQALGTAVEKGMPIQMSKETFANIAYHHTPGYIYEMSDLSNPNAKWVNDIKYGDQVLGARTPKIGSDLRGKSALARCRVAQGKGKSVNIPLVNSGFWISIDPPDESELINLDLQLTSESAEVGMNTNGLLLNSASHVFVRHIVKFILDHITSTNLRNEGGDIPNAVLERVDRLDYPVLCWAILQAMYPDGYPWVLRCSNPTHNHVIKDINLNLRRCYRKDIAALTEKQRELLYRTRSTGITDEELEKYRNEFRLTDKDSFEIELPVENIKVYFKRGTLYDYLSDGQIWVDDIRDNYTRALQTYHSENERSAYLAKQSQVRRLAKFAHMVDKLEFTETGDIVDGREEIYECLISLSGDMKNIEEFESSAIEYLQANNVAIIGYLSQECPQCKTVYVNEDNKRFKSIVPLPVDRIFFTLLRQTSSAAAAMATM